MWFSDPAWWEVLMAVATVVVMIVGLVLQQRYRQRSIVRRESMRQQQDQVSLARLDAVKNIRKPSARRKPSPRVTEEIPSESAETQAHQSAERHSRGSGRRIGILLVVAAGLGAGLGTFIGLFDDWTASGRSSSWLSKGKTLAIEKMDEEKCKYEPNIKIYMPKHVSLRQEQRRQFDEWGPNLEVVLKCFEKAVEEDPNNPLAHRLKADLLSQMTPPRSEKALRAYDACLAIRPNDFEALVGKALVLRDMNRQREGLTYVDKALSLDDSRKGAWLLKARLHLETEEEPDEAFRASLEALAQDPEYTEAWILNGISHGRLGRWAESQSALSKATHLDERDVLSLSTEDFPDDATVWVARAVWFKHRGDLSDATECFQKALQCKKVEIPGEERQRILAEVAVPPELEF